MHTHNHNPDATWETQLVIPEATKSVEERTLDAVLRIEVLLEQLLGQSNVVSISGAMSELLTDITPTETPFLEGLKDTKPKGKRK